jgi:hypothetical protein
LLFDDGIPPEEGFRSWLMVFKNGAPDQNRTDTSSLEGYGSTIELQAQSREQVLSENDYFLQQKIPKIEPLRNYS